MTATSNKVAIWIAVITSLGIIIVAFINGYFSGNAGSSGNAQSVKSSPKIDTGTLQISPIQIQQGDSSKAEVKIENVGRDKIENHNYPAPVPKEKKISRDRRLSKEDILRLQNNIKTGYTVHVVYPMIDREAYDYATEIINKLQEMGCKVEITQAGTIMTPNPNPRFGLKQDGENKASITIIPLSKED